MNLIYGLIVLWVIFNIWFTVGTFILNCNIIRKEYLTIKNKQLWKILFQYIVLLPHMIFAWVCKLMMITPIKSKSK